MIDYIKATEWFHENGSELGRAGGIALVVAALAGAGALSGCKGYVGEGSEGLDPIEANCRQKCEDETYTRIADGNLDIVCIKERDEYLLEQSFSLGCEWWICEMDKDNFSETYGEYSLRVEDRKTCRRTE